MFENLTQNRRGKTCRVSSWDKSGRNDDAWTLEPGETRVLADIEGPAKITHIWMTQPNHYREVVIKITWDNADQPSILCPLGDFFCLGHEIVNSFQSFLFTASTRANNHFNTGCALNCYAQMPFKENARIELINESDEPHRQYFYIDYEKYESELELGARPLYFHAEFRRQNPFGGWGHEITVNHEDADIRNKGKEAWENNYVILETSGAGHYIGCNLSISNFQGTWWGEGDDMIWVDGYKWPPDIHGTGSEDYLNQAWGMQDNAFLRNGSSIYEQNTGGYQTSYVFHLENPVRFEREIKVTIEHGHGNHLRNEVSSVAYWYAAEPAAAKKIPPVHLRRRVPKKDGQWVRNKELELTTKNIKLNEEMKFFKKRWQGRQYEGHVQVKGPIFQQEGQYYMKVQFSPENPALFELELSEILEYQIGKPAILKAYASDVQPTEKPLVECQGILEETGVGLEIKHAGQEETTELSKLLEPLELKECRLETYKVLEENVLEELGVEEASYIYIFKETLR